MSKRDVQAYILHALESRGIEFLVGNCSLSADELIDWLHDETAFWCVHYHCTPQELVAYAEMRAMAIPDSVRCGAYVKHRRRQCRVFVRTSTCDFEQWLPIYRAGVYCHMHG